MSLLLITYNLHGPDRDYEPLESAIRKLGKTKHIPASFESVWWVDTNKTPDDVRQAVMKVIEASDDLYVVDVTGRAYQGNAPEGLWTWIEDHG